MDGLEAVLSFADNLQVFLKRQDGREAGANDGVVVCDQDSCFLHERIVMVTHDPEPGVLVMSIWPSRRLRRS